MAAARGPVPVAVVTVSDTRTPETDVNGVYLRERIEAAGHASSATRSCPTSPPASSGRWRRRGTAGARIVIFNGGTGISHEIRPTTR